LVAQLARRLLAQLRGPHLMDGLSLRRLRLARLGLKKLELDRLDQA
jgi:hypothetical protein